LLEAVIKECIRAYHQRAGTGLAKGLEGLFKFCVVANIQNIEFDSEFQAAACESRFTISANGFFGLMSKPILPRSFALRQ
jgi:hypothetical protein